MKPLVSILIPAFNAEKWIGAAIQSAIAQSWSQKEIIVVDDGSTDQTLTVARRFECGSVRVIAQNNRGSAEARNKGYSVCQGDYIQWLDADDLLAPDKIANQMKIATAESKTTLLSSAWGCFFYRPGKAKFVRTSLWKDLGPCEWLFNKLSEGLWMACQSWLVSRELSELAGPWDVRLSADDDGEYFSRVMLSSERIKFVPEAHSYVSTVNANSLSKNTHSSERKAWSQLESIRLQMQYLRSLEDSGRTREACLKEIQRSMISFYPEFPDVVSQANSLAAQLSGQLRIPELGWKWNWLQHLLGFNIAKQISLRLQGASVWPSKWLDHLCSRLEDQECYKQVDIKRVLG